MISQVAVLGMLLALGARLSAAPAPPPPAPLSAGPFMHNNLPDVWEVLARHGALEAAHQLARKSARSPSRRLRFGRRSDPMVPLQSEHDLEELQDELTPRQVRSPVRLRFGRRSLETVVPHVFPPQDQYDDNAQRKEIRTPSMRLRFGRRSDIFMLPYEQAEREYRGAQDMEADPEE